MQLFEVGGCVRDELLGVPSKDIDFTVVLDEGDFVASGSANPFNVMVQNLSAKGFKIFLKSPEFLTVRAQFPKFNGAPGLIGSERRNLTADFVLARKESDYTDGRRPDAVQPGTLEDDLARRDFTMNAIAKDADGNLIDPFNGQQDIEDRIIRAVGDPFDRLTEDALRAVRAIRFSVTKGFGIEDELWDVINSYEVAELITDKISDERIQVELSKMFRFDTVNSINLLFRFNRLTDAIFSGRVSLDATLKTKGRGK